MLIKDPYDLLYRHLRNLNIMTDAFYLLASVYAFVVYIKTTDKRLLVAFFLYFSAGLISILHHQATHDNLFKYDTFTAGISIAYSIYITTVNILDRKINMLLYTLTFILLNCSFINYYYSQKYNRYLKSYNEDTLEYKYYSIMKYLHHTIWHILSGICACTVPLTFYMD